MKVLIVDDNVAVQEIIKDILADEGHDIQVASSVDEAVDKMGEFGPDVIMLDTWVGDSYGVRAVTRYHEDHPDAQINVILIKSANEQVPKDNQFIKGFIDKPFKSTDVVSVLNSVYKEIMETQSVPVKKKRKPIQIFRKKQQPIDMSSGGDLSEQGLEFGYSYIIFEKEPGEIYRFVGLFSPSSYKVLVVTTDKVKAIKERFVGADLEIVTLSAGGRADSLDIHGLGTLMSRINDFITSHAHPVVVFDNMTEVAEANGLSSVLVMLHQLIDDRERGEATFAVSMDPEILTDKDRGIILHDMIQYKF